MVFKFLLLSAQFIILLMIFVTSSEKQDDILQRNVPLTRNYNEFVFHKVNTFYNIALINEIFSESSYKVAFKSNLISCNNLSFREKTIW